MEHKEHRLAAIVFTDIVGFSKMMEANEAATLELMNYHNEVITRQVREYNGSVIKTVGDAFLLDFRNTSDAVRCSIAIQNEFAHYNKTCDTNPLLLRIGIHLGDIYFFENDALGEGINIASRLQSLANTGSICISQEVYNQIINKLDNTLSYLGKVKLKNITKEIHAYEISTLNSQPKKKQSQTPPHSTGSEEKSSDSTWGNNWQAGGWHGRHKHEADSDEEPDLNELKALILEQVRRAGRRIPVHKIRRNIPGENRREFDKAIDTLSKKGFVTPLRNEDGEVYYGATDQGLSESEQVLDEGGTSRIYKKYREQIKEGAEQAQSGLYAHLGAYAAVNAFLFFIWASTGGGLPWFLFPLGGWGIGMLSHITEARTKKEEAKEVDQLPDLTPPEFKELRKFFKKRQGFRNHIVSTLSVTGFLFMINMITSPGMPWFLFPAIPMGIGLVAHIPAYKHSKRKMKKIFGPLFGKKRAEGRQEQEGISNVVQQAYNLRRTIKTQIKTLGKEQSILGEDLEPILDNYVKQIEEMSAKKNDLDQIIGEIPMQDLENDLASLQKKHDSAQEDYMKKEYDKSIKEIENQQTSFHQLQNHQEVLNLRLSSALNNLKKMQIDLARMKSVSQTQEQASVAMLKEKSDELSEYLEDLRESYSELDQE